ncbi:MAG TPA: response regulator, partial [Gammaproteobacteria bacterium]|nr:response regulator [Gammaproteobacteria bacterium]
MDRNRLKVVVVDDSALMRSMLTDILTRDPTIDVVATANDAYDAREKIKRFNPDVITLDVEMPGMDGIQFLRNLMRLRPMPVVMVSSLTHRGARVTLEALEIGAVEYVSKPQGADPGDFENYARAVVAKVKIAGQARVKSFSRGASVAKASSEDSGGSQEEDNSVRYTKPVADRLIAIGSSTGGTEALKTLLARFPEQCPPVV